MVAKANHDVTITHSVETIPIHYPIKPTGQGTWDYTGEHADEFDECAEFAGVYWGDDSNEYTADEVEWIDADD
jgi:hypothetical protein